MAPHSSTLAWKIPWTEEPGGLQSMGALRVAHDRTTSLSLFTFMHWRRKWQPTPLFLPGESQGQWSLVGGRLWGCTESVMTEATQQQQQQQQQSVNERKECLKTQNGTRPPINKIYFGIILAPDDSSRAIKTIDLNLVEGQITIQIVSFTQIRGTISEYNILVCQVGSEPKGGTDLKTEFGVNAQYINIA